LQANVAKDLMLPGYKQYLFDVLETHLASYLEGSNATAHLDALVANVTAGWTATHEASRWPPTPSHPPRTHTHARTHARTLARMHSLATAKSWGSAF